MHQITSFTTPWLIGDYASPEKLFTTYFLMVYHLSFEKQRHYLEINTNVAVYRSNLCLPYFADTGVINLP